MAVDFTANFTMTIDGRAVESPATLQIVNPATEEVIATPPDATREQLDLAVASSRRAFAGWSATPIAQRQAAVASLAKALIANIDGLSQLLTREQGKPLSAARAEIKASAYWLAEFAKIDLPVETIEDSDTALVQVRHVPVGVVGGIVPWNFPLTLAIWKVAPALVSGNTLLLKPSPFTPLTTLKFGEIARDLLPPGVLNVISGGDALGPWMSAHADIDKISFTGSTPTGRRVMESASKNLKRLTLELGGNDAAIVMPDVDVDKLAQTLFWGAFANSSQFCLAIKRLYVHEAVYDRLAAAFVKIGQAVKLGDGMAEGTMLGPIQNRVQYERLKGLLEDSKTNGHQFLLGGELPAGKGYFFPVTLIDNPPDDSRIVREEPFGPILPMLKFSNTDDAVARANDSEFGLGASVWAGDYQQGLAIAKRLQAGTVWVNQIHALSPHVPLAGHKQSGLGVENGVHGLLEYTMPQTLSVKKI
ncbi:MAG: aldehyde dehydrogenase [Hydrocarboniphaga sp.]|uniref:aldehyde dehydrogenase family protein n=1 Tax=Hydrocarboniphaga sp. TaxID=2033016 RepID=UPI00260E68A1|nr:aldehyde dehydrogenase family protein [Hydrocarboniphaga sp.]MDB5970144.1 aldehyde dehydrogenase [Hydrocarboniphaga sp.]